MGVQGVSRIQRYVSSVVFGNVAGLCYGLFLWRRVSRIGEINLLKLKCDHFDYHGWTVGPVIYCDNR